MRCESSPVHADQSGVEFDIDKPVSILLDGDEATVRDITSLIMDHYRKSGSGFPSGRDSNRNVPGGYGIRFQVYGK